ncbi:MAG: CRTAC1 family protein [Verrucomicrobiota bacterium]
MKRNVLQLNRGDGTYAEIAQLCGLDASEWSWTAVFLDVDLDGYEDVLISTGHDFDTQDSDMQERMNARRPAPREKVSGRLLEYPRLPSPMQAFRNLGNLHFKEVGQEWGFDRMGVKHGVSSADLDNDGDLDVITNDLNDEAGVYRNEGVRPRVAVRLKGVGANTRGIGSKIWLYGGAVPAQSQELICGGRYLSGDEAMRVFAAWTETNRMRIEVRWRSGKRSVVEGVRANREYEIDEAGAEEKRGGTPKPSRAASTLGNAVTIQVGSRPGTGRGPKQ